MLASPISERMNSYTWLESNQIHVTQNLQSNSEYISLLYIIISWNVYQIINIKACELLQVNKLGNFPLDVHLITDEFILLFCTYNLTVTLFYFNHDHNKHWNNSSESGLSVRMLLDGLNQQKYVCVWWCPCKIKVPLYKQLARIVISRCTSNQTRCDQQLLILKLIFRLLLQWYNLKHHRDFALVSSVVIYNHFIYTLWI